MKVTFLKDRNRYVAGSSGRQITVAEYGKDFYNCQHDFQDTRERGTTFGGNGKRVQAALHQCTKCLVYTVIEAK
jgi:hypothetical protein